MSLLAQPLPGRDEARIDANRRIVDEDAIVHARDVDTLRMARGDGLHRFSEIERDAGILRKVIERAEREHPKRGRRTGECSGDRADRSISATCDNGFGVRVERHSRCGRNAAGIGELADARVDAGVSKQFFDFFAKTRAARDTTRGIQHDRHHRN